MSVATDTIFDHSTFYGRLRYFAAVTNPLRVFDSQTELLAAKRLYDQSKKNEVPPGTTISDLQRAHAVVGAAFHPDTGDLQNVAGRMCANVYGSTALCGGMMIFYKSAFGVFFWQWANQSFNALVNYTNRNAKSALSNTDCLVAYTSAVTGALGCAFSLKHHFAKTGASVTVQRLVPLAAVCVANFINIPLMRQNELRNGLCVTDAEGNEIGKSQLAAAKAISLVALSRNIIVIPSMLFTPSIVDFLESKFSWFKQNLRLLNIPAQLALVFVLFGGMVPVGCALFPQQNSLNATSLKYVEPELYEKLQKKNVNVVYFNKGL